LKGERNGLPEIKDGVGHFGSKALSQFPEGDNGEVMIPIGSLVKLHSLQNEVLNGQIVKVT